MTREQVVGPGSQQSANVGLHVAMDHCQPLSSQLHLATPPQADSIPLVHRRPQSTDVVGVVVAEDEVAREHTARTDNLLPGQVATVYQALGALGLQHFNGSP